MEGPQVGRHSLNFPLSFLGFVCLMWFFTDWDPMGFITIKSHHFRENIYGTFSKHQTSRSKLRLLYYIFFWGGDNLPILPGVTFQAAEKVVFCIVSSHFLCLGCCYLVITRKSKWQHLQSTCSSRHVFLFATVDGRNTAPPNLYGTL